MVETLATGAPYQKRDASRRRNSRNSREERNSAETTTAAGMPETVETPGLPRDGKESISSKRVNSIIRDNGNITIVNSSRIAYNSIDARNIGTSATAVVLQWHTFYRITSMVVFLINIHYLRYTIHPYTTF
jgi:hypothetical protein